MDSEGAQPLALDQPLSTVAFSSQSSEVGERNVKALVSMTMSNMAANIQLEPPELANTEVFIPSHYFAIEEGQIRGVRQNLMLLLLTNLSPSQL